MLKQIYEKVRGRIHIFLVMLQNKNALSISYKNGIHRKTRFNIQDGGRLEINKLTTFADVYLSVVGGNLKIGKNVFMNQQCMLVCRDKIEIGDNCIFGPRVMIYDHDHEFSVDGVNRNSYKLAPVVIEESVWIGAGVIILRGSHIGAGSVIGAGSIIKGEIPANSLVTSERDLIIKKIN